MNNVKKLSIMSLMLIIGVALGLIVASNLSLTEPSIAENRTEVQIGATDSLTEVSADLMATSKAFVRVSKKVMPTVVSITSEKVVRVQNSLFDFFHDDLFRGRPPRGNRDEFRQDGLGSGVIISPDGYIVTNNHVIREAESISVRLDRRRYDAEIIGSDPQSDLAVIKIDGEDLPVAGFGDSDNLEVGELVLAIGNPFSIELAHSVTAGIVSGKGRTRVGVGDIDYEDFIQTDAAINPGNSGGALVNLRGELVGINTAIVSGGWGGGNVGIGFAIPINLARNVIEQLINNGEVVRGWLGVYIQNVDQDLAEQMGLPSVDGALVQRVTDGSPAMKAGLQEEDFITEIDGIQIRDSNHLMNVVANYQPESVVTVRYFRNSKKQSIRIELGRRPDQTQALARTERPSMTLGLRLTELTEELAQRFGHEEESGLLVLEVESGSQAEEKGMQPGDLIREVNREKISSVAEFRQIVEQTAAGESILLRIVRESGSFFVALKVKIN